MTNRQTVSFIRNRFDEAGLRPVTRFGQNFLVDLNLLELLARSGEVGGDDVILEVGTGLGSLTALVAPAAAEVVTVEIDPHVFMLAQEELAVHENVTMLQQDVLRNKNSFAQNVLDTLKEKLAVSPNRRLKLLANLPYNVATPIISNLLRTDLDPSLIVVTIQKELGDRIVANPGTKDYGALSIWIQAQADAEIVRVMSPKVFWPRPKVHSAIVAIRPNEEKRSRIPNLGYFHWFARAMFFHRRKFMRSVILSAFKKRLDKPTVDEVMSEMSLGADARSEQLGVEEMIQLGELLRARLPGEWDD
ncbi:MAG TPA: ribosomal RNA small subunit methyltransferase A [Planctomycetaceae bacterium]|jgi:16S rRNA (adenine1518-N6/adenine1519-N6)-dimethyltransferase|nr:16S rRNA (adenine(1518)-N(6)/adenine(1519)-N(6))-dimethyltransferase RsmA [Pirellulales bacterium]HAL14841.1 ribosomal RNA small subunit methyltransferase A [Planctomycetaceae bacterium]HCK72535.1 ribosomal RNA small subunit methyltransferase A [Planctomycetaceae bacterium]HCP85744.1 ribosomal RNA small subunit methyltransferase A [Planctomycetaceae bacterium]|tara:strand:- start:571 stop:1482 length:912 start_codon:yes stop_codon:yes gene_type:complete